METAERVITEKEVKQAISVFFEYNHPEYDTKQGILLIQIKDSNPECTSITIVTKRPGLLIGKRGETIDALKAFLRRAMDIKELNILISEFDTFNQDNEQLYKHWEK